MKLDPSRPHIRMYPIDIIKNQATTQLLMYKSARVQIMICGVAVSKKDEDRGEGISLAYSVVLVERAFSVEWPCIQTDFSVSVKKASYC